MMSKKIVMIDGMALFYRSHFAFGAKPMVNSKGLNTTAMFAFSNTLLELVEELKPSHLLVVTDTSAPTARHALFPAYKAQRESMPEDLSAAIPYLWRLIEAFQIPLLKKDGLEADDIIGILAQRAEREGFDEVLMVTPDKDYGQLVTDKIKMYKHGRKGAAHEVLGVKEICEKWQIEKTSQVIDILALMGDSSDNIPGVPGIGEKTATTLIQKYGSVENLLAHTHELKGKQKTVLEEQSAMALLCKQLVTIDTVSEFEYDLEDSQLKAYDRTLLLALFQELEFKSLTKRLLGGQEIEKKQQLQGELDLIDNTEVIAGHLKKLVDIEVDYQLIDDLVDAQKWIDHFRGLNHFCFDLETDHLDPLQARIVAVALCAHQHQAYCWILPTEEKEYQKALNLLRMLFLNEQVTYIGHNLKFDLSILKSQGIEVRGKMFDTMLAHSLLYPEQKHGMDDVAEKILDYQTIRYEDVFGSSNDLFENSLVKTAQENPQLLLNYAAEDADVTWQFYEIFRDELKKMGGLAVVEKIEFPLIKVLVNMELSGILVDVGMLKLQSLSLEKTLIELEEKIYDYAGTSFNIKSPKQLGEILFERLKLLDKPKKTATGQYQTNEQTLLDLEDRHPMIASILDYREVAKLKSTYTDALPGFIHPSSGRIHTSFHQLIAATGRMASNQPNLQNIPIWTQLGKEIRKAFVAKDEDWVLLSADYSQIELRIIASLAGDPTMIEAFKQGEDIHRATAARIYDIPLSEVNDDQRRNAKMVNFGIIYGISAFGLSQRLHISRQEAASIIEAYFKQFPKVKLYMERVATEAREKGYVETLCGRRRYLRDIDSANQTVRAAAERVAINAPIQGTAADMIKLAMIGVFKALNEKHLKSRMLLQVHDELLLEVPKFELEQVTVLVREEMIKALPLPAVPIEVSVGYAANWLEAH
jgi:DNA polymerase-1